MYGITLSTIFEKRKYVTPLLVISVVAYSLLAIITSIRELIMLKGDLTWVFPQWYFVRVVSCISIIFLINEVKRLKIKCDEK